jgi:hypothetical protein
LIYVVAPVASPAPYSRERQIRDPLVLDTRVGAEQRHQRPPEQRLAGDGADQGFELQLSGGAGPGVQRIERTKGRYLRTDPGKGLIVGRDAQANIVGDALKACLVGADFPGEPPELSLSRGWGKYWRIAPWRSGDCADDFGVRLCVARPSTYPELSVILLFLR